MFIYIYTYIYKYTHKYVFTHIYHCSTARRTTGRFLPPHLNTELTVTKPEHRHVDPTQNKTRIKRMYCALRISKFCHTPHMLVLGWVRNLFFFLIYLFLFSEKAILKISRYSQILPYAIHVRLLRSTAPVYFW